MDFSKQIQKAEEAARRRNYDFAVQLYRQLLEIDADQAEARAGLRRVLLKRHETKKGGKLFRTLAGAGPLAMAKGLAKAGRHDAAAKALESFLETDPTNEEANLLLGSELEAGGHLRSAGAVFEFLAEVAPRSVEGRKRAGNLARKLGDPAKALEHYERALEVDPRDQEAIKARKDLSAEQALLRSEQPGIQHSREQMRDKDEAARLERSQRLVRSEEDLQAELAELETRYAESPGDPDLLERMGAVHERLGDPEAALDVMERALSYRKDSFDLLAKVGDLKAKSLKKAIRRADTAGDRAEADRLEADLRAHELDDLRGRVALRPGDAALRLALGRKLLRADEHDAAAAEFQKAVVDVRAAREAHVGLAQCFQAKGYLDLARKEYERALEGGAGLDERAKEILYNLGAIAEVEGRTDEARERYARIFEVDIGYRDVAGKMEGFRRT